MNVWSLACHWRGVALAHRANANMVRKWVLKYQQGAYGQIPEMGTAMLPVVVRKRSHVNAPPKYAAPTPVLEIELARGVVRFYGATDATVLESFIATLSGR